MAALDRFYCNSLQFYFELKFMIDTSKSEIKIKTCIFSESLNGKKLEHAL